MLGRLSSLALGWSGAGPLGSSGVVARGAMETLLLAPSKSVVAQVCAECFRLRRQPGNRADMAAVSAISTDLDAKQAARLRKALTSLLSAAVREPEKPPPFPNNLDQRLCALLTRIIEHHRAEWHAELSSEHLSPMPTLISSAVHVSQPNTYAPISEPKIFLQLSLSGDTQRQIELNKNQLSGMIQSLEKVKDALDRI